MPCALDHYRFALRHLPDADFAKARSGLVLLGAQGPDPFYFRGILPWRQRRNVERSRAFAEFAHGSDPESLFAALASVASHQAEMDAEGTAAEGTAVEGAWAFLYGLLLHYALDAAVHPYVYSRSGFDGEGKLSGRHAADHARFETGIAESIPDEARHASVRPRAMLAANPEDVFFADSLLAAAFPDRVRPGDYSESWSDMVAVLELLWDPSGFKRALADALGFGASHARAMMRPGLPRSPAGLDYLNLSQAAWPHPSDGKESSAGVAELTLEAEGIAARGLRRLAALRDGAGPHGGWDELSGGVNHEGTLPGRVMRHRAARLNR